MFSLPSDGSAASFPSCCEPACACSPRIVLGQITTIRIRNLHTYLNLFNVLALLSQNSTAVPCVIHIVLTVHLSSLRQCFLEMHPGECAVRNVYTTRDEIFPRALGDVLYADSSCLVSIEKEVPFRLRCEELAAEISIDTVFRQPAEVG